MGIKIPVFILALTVCACLALGLALAEPVVAARLKYETKAYDKILATGEDFKAGKANNVEIAETESGVELGAYGEGMAEYITPAVESFFPATHIGLHWKGKNANSAISVYLRTGNDGENFGEWLKLEVEGSDGPGGYASDEIFAVLVGVNREKYAQAKIEFPASSASRPKLNEITFTFINTGEETRQVAQEPGLTVGSVGTLKASPNGQVINVISREEWGADESYRFDRRGNEKWVRSYHGTRKLAVHHTANPASNGVTDLEANKAEVRAIYYYHAVTQRWGDIGYSALVDAAGNIYEGRYGTHESARRLDPAPEQIMVLDIEAGHTGGYNSGSFGVAALGDFTSYIIPAAQLAGVEDVLAFTADSRGIDPLGNSDFMRYDETWHYGLDNIFAHRDATATACPGDKFYPLMDNIKQNVSSRAGMLPNIAGFSAIVGGVDIGGQEVGGAMIDFTWEAFAGAAQYQYALERVYAPGGSGESESWQEAWLELENPNMVVTDSNSAQIDANNLITDSNYVFYLRGIDIYGKPVTAVTHVNFWKNSAISDSLAPVVNIIKPADGATVSGIVAIAAAATDNAAVVGMDLMIDGKKVASSTSGSISYSWNARKVAVGSHVIEAYARDAAGNIGSDSIMVYR